MRAEELLREPERIERKILILAREIDRIRQGLYPGGVDYALDRVQGGEGVDRYPAAVDRIIARENRIRELNSRRLWLVEALIPWLLSQIQDELTRDIIELHYCGEPMTMEQIADKVHVARRTVFRKRDAGLEDLQKILDSLDSAKIGTNGTLDL